MMRAEFTDVDRIDEACYLFQQQNLKGLSQYWLLLDSQSSIDMFCNQNYLRNIKMTEHPTTITCNAGSMVCTKVGAFVTELFGDIPVKCNPKGMSNMVSFKTIKKLFPIMYESNLTDGGGTTFEYT